MVTSSSDSIMFVALMEIRDFDVNQVLM